MTMLTPQSQSPNKQGQCQFRSDWRCVRLGDHSTKIGSGLTPEGGHRAYANSGIPFIRSQNVHLNEFVADGLAYIPEKIDRQMEGSRVFPGDVLLNITGASIGRVCVVPDALCPANVNQHVSIIRCRQDLLPMFLSYYLATPDFQRYILESQAGATRQALTKRQIAQFEIPLPSIEAQRRIVTVLNEEMAAVGRARTAAEGKLEAAQDFPAACLRAIFNGPQAHQWLWKRLGEIAELLPSKSIVTDGDTEVLAVTTACLTEVGFQPAGVKRARMRAHDAAKCVVSFGEVLVARSNTPDLVGRAAMFAGAPPNVVASDLTIRVSPKDGLNPNFLAAYLSFLYLSGYWKERAGGASGTMKKITRTQIQAEGVPIPPPVEQQQIATILSGKLKASESMYKALQEELNTIAALPPSLLRQAFNGEI